MLPVSSPSSGEKATCCFVFISSCPDAWGGSEELWRGAALRLSRAGHSVYIFKTYVQWFHPRIVQLLAAGCHFTDLLSHPPVHTRVLSRMLPARWRHQQPMPERLLHKALHKLAPHLAIVSQGGNLDGAPFAEVCRRLGQPYVLVAQKAAEIFLPYDEGRAYIKQIYQAAQHCFFVSRHNLALTQRHLAQLLPHASVVANPFNVPFDGELPAPALDGTWQLACVARLDILDKGQDILLQVLALVHWRTRPVHITFYGTGPHRQALEEMAEFLGVATQVSFAGQVADVPGIWRKHHALVLPSRYEGLPLALVEAMLCGRPAIAANAGGIAEILVDNETGFLAAEASPASFDEALERAWARRAEWPSIGAQAAAHARATVPADAAADFSQQLLDLAHELAICSTPTPAAAL
jgi:glycosyltransferase involved in cell wall biosynthesis